MKFIENDFIKSSIIKSMLTYDINSSVKSKSMFLHDFLELIIMHNHKLNIDKPYYKKLEIRISLDKYFNDKYLLKLWNIIYYTDQSGLWHFQKYINFCINYIKEQTRLVINNCYHLDFIPEYSIATWQFKLILRLWNYSFNCDDEDDDTLFIVKTFDELLKYPNSNYIVRFNTHIILDQLYSYKDFKIQKLDCKELSNLEENDKTLIFEWNIIGNELTVRQYLKNNVNKKIIKYLTNYEKVKNGNSYYHRCEVLDILHS